MSYINVLTYDAPHHKTQMLVMMLRAYGWGGGISLLTLPYERMKPKRPLYPHRPVGDASRGWNITPQTLGNMYHCTVRPASPDSPLDEMADGVTCIAGARLLGDPWLELGVLNAHPGILPHFRGRDANQWAILEGATPGLTLHAVDASGVDSGPVYVQVDAAPNVGEPYHEWAHRLYCLEIELLAELVVRKARGGKLRTLFTAEPEGEIRRGLTFREELAMMEVYRSRWYAGMGAR